MSKIFIIILLTTLEAALTFGQGTACNDLVVENLAMDNDTTMKITIRNNCISCGSWGGYADLRIIQNSIDTIAKTNCMCLFSPAGVNNPKTYYVPSKVTDIPPINQLRVSMMSGVCDTIPLSPTLGINENKKKSKIKIYPNPTKNLINISLENNPQHPLLFELYDILGKKLLQEKITSPSSVNISSFPSGIYFYKITDGENKTAIGKIIRQ